MKLPFFKKADIILAAVLVAAGAVCFAFAAEKGSSGSVAVVTVDGSAAARIPLTEDRRESVVESAYGTNTFLVENGAISVTDADCPGKDCMQFRPISSSGQVIICAPHHLVVTVEGPEDGPDAVVR